MNKGWDSGDRYRRCSVGELHGHLATTARRLTPRDWWGSPRNVALRLIDAYRADATRTARCTRPQGRSCSTLARAYIARYGAVQGTLLAVWVVMTCATVNGSCGDEPRPHGRRFP